MDTKKIAIWVGIILIILAVLLFVKAPVSAPTMGALPPEGQITIFGTVVCLPHKDQSGPQTLECAFGLRDEGGRYYALRDTDPNYSNVSSAPMNVPVMVTGTFTPQPSNIYQDIGVISVTSISPVTDGSATSSPSLLQ